MFDKDHNWRIFEVALKEMEKMSYDDFFNFIDRDCILFNLTCMKHNFCLAIEYKTTTYYSDEDEDDAKKVSFDISIFYKDKNDNLEFNSKISNDETCNLFYPTSTERVKIKREEVLEKGVSFIVENIKNIVENFSTNNKLFRDFINLKKYNFSILCLILEQAYYGLPYYERSYHNHYNFRFDEIFNNKIEEAKKLYYDIVSLEKQIDDKKKEIMKIMNKKLDIVGTITL